VIIWGNFFQRFPRYLAEESDSSSIGAMPLGYSEYVCLKVNDVSFTVFVQDHLEHSMKTYLKATEKQCVKGFRHDVIGK
jgi:hypothetical protein